MEIEHQRNRIRRNENEQRHPGGLGVDPGGGLEWCSAAAFWGVRAAHWPHAETFQLHFYLFYFWVFIVKTLEKYNRGVSRPISECTSRQSGWRGEGAPLARVWSSTGPPPGRPAAASSPRCRPLGRCPDQCFLGACLLIVQMRFKKHQNRSKNDAFWHSFFYIYWYPQNDHLGINFWKK